MAAARRPRRRAQGSSGGGSTTQQDEADIVQEVGAERDEESGDLRTDEQSILAAGAVDAESVRENRRLQNIVNRKRAHEKDVPFNVGDIIAKYDTALRFWPANTLWINVKRLTGNPVTHVIMTYPKSGPELYAELMRLHGEHDEAKYELRVIDSNTKEYRTNGQITLPDTRPKQPQQQGQPTMSAPQYPYPYPGYPYPQQPQQQQPPWQPPPWQQQPPPWQGAPQQQPPQQQPQQPQQPQAEQPQQQQPPQQPAQPQVHYMPPPPGPDPMQVMQQTFQMFQQMRESLMAQQPQQPPPPQPPPMPSPQADPNTMMGWFQQMFQMFQDMQRQGAQVQMPGAPAQQQPQQQQNPFAMMGGMMGMPPMTPPAGTIWVPGFGFVPLEKLAQVVGGGGGPGYRGGAPYRPPYGGPGGPGGYPGGEGGPYRPPAPTPQRTAAEQFQDAVSVVQTAVDAVRQVNALLPQQQAPAAPVQADSSDDDEDSPIRVVDTGHGKLVLDKSDGTIRKWETGWANMKEIMDFVAEQREAFQKGRQPQQQEVQQLPPGHVVVTEGYTPPPGMVAVPVSPQQVAEARQQQQPQPQQPPAQQAPPQQGGLPPPPANMPPPIHATPPPQRTWEPPTLPGQGR